MANSLFDYNSFTWAFLEGCMCAIVSPAIIAVEIIKLQESGLGQGQGPFSLMLSAVSLEVCAGVWATSFILDLLFNQGSLVKSIILGPVQLLGGGLIGVGVGFAFFHLVAFLKRIGPRTKTGHCHPAHEKLVMKLSYCLFLTLSCGFVFFGNNQNLAGGGSVVVVAFSATIAQLWPAEVGDRELRNERKFFAQSLSFTWDMLAMPALFCIVGTTINIKDLFNSTFTPKMIAITACALAARMLVTYAVQWRRPYDWKQKLLVCGGYAGKATAQAAMAPLALLKVASLIETEGYTSELVEKQRKAKIVAQAAQFFVLVMVPVCTITLSKWGTYVLPRKEPSRIEAREGRVSRADDKEAPHDEMVPR
jgi:solute carrier family 9B (sodium/hydrogen exchanger), member 1/2